MDMLLTGLQQVSYRQYYRRKKQMNGILKINEEGDLKDESSDLLTKRKL